MNVVSSVWQATRTSNRQCSFAKVFELIDVLACLPAIIGNVTHGLIITAHFVTQSVPLTGLVFINDLRIGLSALVHKVFSLVKLHHFLYLGLLGNSHLVAHPNLARLSGSLSGVDLAMVILVMSILRLRR